MSKEIISWLSANILPFEPDVRRWLRRFQPLIMDEDDIIQEAYCKIANVENPSHIRSGRAYFFMVAKNIMLEQMRRQRLVRIDALAEIESSYIIDEEPSAERVFDGRKTLALVGRLMRRLPERTRAVLMLRRVEGLSQREAAARLGVTENVIEKQIALGVKSLLEQLKDVTEDDDFLVRRQKRDRRRNKRTDGARH